MCSVRENGGHPENGLEDFMTYMQRKAMKLLDHAIEHLGSAKACGMMILDGKVARFLPADDNNTNAARAVLARAMCAIVKEVRS
jgi:hypothetical protein